MMILIRYLLILLVVYLLIRSFMKYGKDDATSVRDDKSAREKQNGRTGVSKSIGEYVDYEELDKQE